ncbi:peptidoglycan D,D-transpeptidase FtsI family protein [Patescibacteria group bacterium]
MTKRIIIIRWSFLLVFLIIAVRLLVLQVAHSEIYQELAENQLGAKNGNIANRGNIFFSTEDGPFLAATQKTVFTLAINPREIENAEEVYAHLSQFIEVDEQDFFTKAKRDDPFEIIKRRIDDELKDKILKAAPVGVKFVEEKARFYPAKELASHVLGFVGEDESGLKGKYGVEQYYESYLKSDNIILGIDANVQSFTEHILVDVVEKYNAEGGGVIIVEPKTGRIISMAANPTYDPNRYFEEENFRVFLNPLIQSNFEMGSVVKPLTVAAGLDAGVIVPETTYFDYGKVEVEGDVIENFDGKGRGLVNMQEILSQSLNTGVVFIAEKLGKENFRKYFENFGLGGMTKVDLASEVSGNLKNLDSPRFIEYATASFGQGIGVTPLGLTMALSSLANGGFLMRPFIADEMYSFGGEFGKTKPQIEKRVISEESSRTITRMLVNVVDTTLAGGKGQISGYSMAAKTGTAEIASSIERGYTGESIHSFFGYAPAFDARFLIFIYIEKPYGVRYASQSLTQPFKEMMQFLLHYYEVLPDRT